MSYLLYRAIRKGTNVDLSCRCNFTDRSASDELVLVKGNTLELWTTEEDSLQHLLSFQLASTPQAIARVKFAEDLVDSLQRQGNIETSFEFPKSTLECLVLTFEEAKVSIVAFDTVNPSVLKTIAIFNFGADALGTQLKANKKKLMGSSFGFSNALAFAVDPDFRCMVMLVHGSTLAVVPFTQGQDAFEATDVEDYNGSRGVICSRDSLSKMPEAGNGHPLIGVPYLVPMSLLGISEGLVKDFTFLNNQNHPTLCVLHSDAIRPWAARSMTARYTSYLTAFVLHQPLSPLRVWEVARLPHDALRISPLESKESSNGVMLVSVNALQYVSPSHVYNVATNGFAPSSLFVNEKMPLFNAAGSKWSGTNLDLDHSDMAVTLDGSSFAWINPRLFLVVLSTGAVLCASLDVSAGLNSSTKLRVKLMNSVVAKTTGLVNLSGVDPQMKEARIFVGSRLGDSMLLRVKGGNLEEVVAVSSSPSPPLKRVKVEDTREGVTQTYTDEEAFLYEDAPPPVQQQPTNLKEVKLSLLDTLPSVGPLTDLKPAEGPLICG